MASTYMTPGVYIEEKNAFPNSAVAVETAVPVFIGYTETASFNNNALLNVPTRITSFAEYNERFGPVDVNNPYKPQFTISKTAPTSPGPNNENTFIVNGATWYVEAKNPLYLYNSIRLFYANGGSTCYILSVGTYGDDAAKAVSQDDFLPSSGEGPFDALKKESEPTLVVMPDAIALGAAAYNTIYTTALQHCNDMQSRFAILDLVQQSSIDSTDGVVEAFRDAIGINYLNYGAAYYPWLKTSIITPSEVDLGNFDLGGANLTDILPETGIQKIKDKYDADTATATANITAGQTALTAAQTANDPVQIAAATKALSDLNAVPAKITENYIQALKANSATYVALVEKLRAKMNELPPSGAMAGIYTAVDNNRGVWKAPANVSVSMVNAPSVNVSSEMQQNLNVDVMAGKSINVIRSFPGVGTLVWGGRTLDGNSQDWRYINVRRTLIMIEQSLKLAARAYVFEPNDANTWITVKSMFDNFLVNLWKQGALAGAVPEQAFSVQVGLGSTMTANDILDGNMLITVKVAIVRPAEFIIITFQQQMQES
jgi:phage tail sheath protein FI